jgi:hypothetical protein
MLKWTPRINYFRRTPRARSRCLIEAGFLASTREEQFITIHDTGSTKYPWKAVLFLILCKKCNLTGLFETNF